MRILIDPLFYWSFTILHNTNYAFSKVVKKTAHAVTICPNVHSITSRDQQEAIDLIRWTFAVANTRADSPRFCWYVSRWAVPEKIARAKQNGTFDCLVANCPPIDPAWVRFVPAALAACAAFKDQTTKPRPPARASLPNKPRPRKPLPIAA